MKASRLLTTGTPILLFAVALFLTGCNGGGGGSGAGPADISGTWTGVMTQESLAVPLVLTITQDGENVLVEWTGDYGGEVITDSFAATYVNGTLTAAEEGSTITLRFSGNTARGTVTDAEGTAQIELTKA